jgi:hypothetical protein
MSRDEHTKSQSKMRSKEQGILVTLLLNDLLSCFSRLCITGPTVSMVDETTGERTIKVDVVFVID